MNGFSGGSTSPDLFRGPDWDGPIRLLFLHRPGARAAQPYWVLDHSSGPDNFRVRGFKETTGRKSRTVALVPAGSTGGLPAAQRALAIRGHQLLSGSAKGPCFPEQRLALTSAPNRIPENEAGRSAAGEKGRRLSERPKAGESGQVRFRDLCWQAPGIRNPVITAARIVPDLRSGRCSWTPRHTGYRGGAECAHRAGCPWKGTSGPEVSLLGLLRFHPGPTPISITEVSNDGRGPRPTRTAADRAQKTHSMHPRRG